MRHCTHQTYRRVLVPGDFQPDGVRYPRCGTCYHRVCAEVDPWGKPIDCPKSTRSIAMRHPGYIFTEVRGRVMAWLIVYLGRSLATEYHQPAEARAREHEDAMEHCDIHDEAKAHRDRVCIGCGQPEGSRHDDDCVVMTGRLGP